MKNFILRIWAFFSQEKILVKKVVEYRDIHYNHYIPACIRHGEDNYIPLLYLGNGKYDCPLCAQTDKIDVLKIYENSPRWKAIQKKRQFANAKKFMP